MNILELPSFGLLFPIPVREDFRKLPHGGRALRVITPYGGFSMLGDRRYRAGWRLSLGDSFNLSLEGDRTETDNTPSRHAVALRGDLRW